MHATRLALMLGSAVGLAVAAEALDIYIVRHAETLANVTKEYTEFNQRHFSREGEKQIARLTRALQGRRFDAVVTSPAHRTLRTIEPFLASTGGELRAEIWPELDECCWQKDRKNDRTPPGRPILIEAGQALYFYLRRGAATETPGSETYEDSLRRVRWVAGEIWRRWGGTDAVVLVATHFFTGGRLIELLLDDRITGEIRLENAKVSHVREENGRFRLVGLNLPPAEVDWPTLTPVKTP